MNSFDTALNHNPTPKIIRLKLNIFIKNSYNKICGLKKMSINNKNQIFS